MYVRLYIPILFLICRGMLQEVRLGVPDIPGAAASGNGQFSET